MFEAPRSWLSRMLSVVFACGQRVAYATVYVIGAVVVVALHSEAVA